MEKIVFGKRLEDADFVETVEELGLEFAAGDEMFNEIFFEIVDMGACGDAVADIGGASIGGGDNDTVAEANLAVAFVTEDAFV